ncbi:hypothetical protein MLD38_018739 [Melastoma candidum]|uniref:Uncharacterized protein n=1 Tax=Melastoma candidum TaxID=119954 RepID=A0ACB9QTY0_9MYRT|nr:hypothetical protein MLD38_018739 [Melastoma candidum]
MHFPMECSLPMQWHLSLPHVGGSLAPGFRSSFLPPSLPLLNPTVLPEISVGNGNRIGYSPPSCVTRKIVRNPALDKHVVKQNRIRFVQKLKTLLLSKPRRFLPIYILEKCRSYLALPKTRPILQIIRRYPTLFELFTIPMPPIPRNAAKSGYQLCVRLTPAASSLADRETKLKAEMSYLLASKLQKLLMLSSHRRLLLSKLVHLGPDLGLPPNFRSRLCNEYPDKFKVVDTSYGHALELVSWNPDLAQPVSFGKVDRREFIVDRPLKFRYLKLQKGLNLKRRHQEFLFKFQDQPDVCPYTIASSDLAKESIQAEKRACALVREVLAMMVEKRTLVDHLTHFKKEFGLSNKLRSMLVRHPEMFYVSVKGQRDSVVLNEGYDDKGVLLEKDESSIIKDQLMDLIMDGKRMRRAAKADQMKPGFSDDIFPVETYPVVDLHGEETVYDDDGFEDLFDSDDSDLDLIGMWDSEEEDDWGEKMTGEGGVGEFWVAESAASDEGDDTSSRRW